MTAAQHSDDSAAKSLAESRLGCLIGPLWSRKSQVLRGVAKDAPLSLFLDCDTAQLSPELFSLSLVAKFRQQADAKGKGFLATIDNELEKIKPDQSRILRNAFSFLDHLGSKKDFVLCFDHIERLSEMNNFSGIKDIGSFLKETKSIRIYGTTDLPTLLKKKIPGFTFVTVSDSQVSPEDAKKLDSTVGLACRYHLEKALGKARGQSMLSAVLNTVAVEALTLTEISRKIFRSAPVTKSLLERLMEVDLIERRGRKFYVKDAVLAVYLKARQEVGA